MVRIIISIIGFAAAVAIFFVYTQPTYETTRSMQAQNGQYDQALAKANELQQLKQTLLSRYNALDPAALERLQKLLPDHVDNVRLILDIDSLATRYGLGLENVEVGAPESSGNTKTIAGTIGSQSRVYDSLTLRFNTHGTYASFSAFMKDLESSLRIVDLENLEISRERVLSSGVLSYRYSLTLRTYWLK